MAKTQEIFNEKIAVGDLGTQLFWLNREKGKFEYALPVVSGAEFGGDTESFDAPESDLPYVPKVSGRSSLNDIVYTSNMTPERYARWKAIVDSTEDNTYLEVLSDGSAMMFSGTGGVPRILSGDVRQIEQAIIAKKMEFIANVLSITADEKTLIQSMMKNDAGEDITLTATEPLPFDVDSIPSGRISEVEEKYSEE